MLRRLRLLGQAGLEMLGTMGRAGIIWWRSLFWWPDRVDWWGLLIRQVYVVGVLSVVIIVLSAFSIGAVLGLQFYTQLVYFGAENNVGLGVALTLLRELGPVVTALLFAGRAGSALTAEIGLMKTTEQLDAMEMMGVDPLHEVIAPRLWAGFICMPLLAMMFSTVAIWGGAVVGISWLGIDEGTFWTGMQDGVDFGEDVWNGIIKTLVFGVVVTWVAVFQGYDCVPTAEGISQATTRTVVYSSVWVLALDFFLTLVMFGEF
jgi:phospholipid/cholesterol/gamma-HCH transport system permease protein